MRILERLRQEHRLIERVAGSLVTFADGALTAERPAETLDAFCDFFSGYADARHHAMEEDILLRALRDAELPEEGPIAVIRGEHAQNRVTVDALRALSRAGRFDDPRLVETARAYCARLWEHIDKEDSVLFPECEARLRLERPRLDRELDAHDALHGDGAALAAVGAALVERFAPRAALPGVFRGEGCAVCRHFGDGCQGVEHAWWSELEWESFHARDF